MAEADFGLSNYLENVPQINLGDVLPSTPVTPLAERRAPIIVNAPRAETALQNKYAGFMRQLATQYPAELVNAMMDFDAKRVRNGQPPLSEEETVAALNTALTGQPTTPEPKKKINSIDSFFKNAVSDIGAIVTSIPRLPVALYHEFKGLGQMGEGSNAAQQLLNAPGVRLIPGAFVAANVLGGTSGELARHPVFTALDVLPAAQAVAKTSPVYREAVRLGHEARTLGDLGDLTERQFRRVERLERRPISTALGNRLTPEGELFDKLRLPVRSPIGQFTDALRTTKLGEFLTQNFKQEARDFMFGVNNPVSVMNAMLEGKRLPRNEMEAIMKSAVDLDATIKAIDPALATPESMALLYDRAISGNLDDLSDTQRAAIDAYLDARNKLTAWALENDKLVRFEGEIYDVRSGAELLIAKKKLTEIQSLKMVRDMMTGADPMGAVDLFLTRMRSPVQKPPTFGYRQSMAEKAADIQRGAVSPQELLLGWRTTRQTLRNAGYDTGVLDRIASRKGDGIRSDKFRKALEDFKAGRLELPRGGTMTLEEVLSYAKANWDKSVGYRDVYNGIIRGEWKGVTAALDNLRGSPPEFQRTIRNLRDNARLMENKKLKAATEEGVKRAEQALAEKRLENIPARLQPRMQQITRNEVAQELILEQRLIPATDRVTVEEILRARDAGELSGIPGFTEEMYRMHQREAAKTILKMRDEGFNPLFVHTVPVNRVNASLRFTENIVPHTPSQLKERLVDLTPGIKNLAISISDEAMQFLNVPLQEARVKWVADNFGYNIHEVNAILHESARYRAGRNEAFDYEGHKTGLIKDRFRPLDPDELGLWWGSPYISQLKTDKVYVPIEVYRNLKAMELNKPFFGGLMDPITKTFRISTTALSLRTQIYNIIGGAVTTTLMNPLALVRYSGEAIKMLRNPNMIPEEFVHVIGSTERTMLQLDKESKGIVVEGVRKYLVGKKLRQAWDEAQARKVDGQPITRFGAKIHGLVEKSYQLNGMFDDFYRAVTYLDEYNRQLGKGYTEEVARYKAVGAARQVLQDYLGMTPFERNVVKSVLPFYGFLGHAIRFVLRYPLDHPLRTEFMAKLAEAELENLDGLPNRFMAMLFYGSPDNVGNRHSLNLGPFNPFGDVANSMTLAGFLGNTNPILQTAFEMVGLERGTAELYPSLRYNPDTGRMEAARPSLLSTLAGNIIPQSGGLLALLGMNQQYEEMLQRDPESAGRYLLGTMTIPILEREYNVPQEIFAAELARQRSADSVLSTALKSGNWSEAMTYPSLAAYLKALETLPPETLDQFRQEDSADLLERARQAFGGQTAVQVPTATESAMATLDELVEAQLALGPIGAGGGMSAPVSGLAAGGALGLNGI